METPASLINFAFIWAAQLVKLALVGSLAAALGAACRPSDTLRRLCTAVVGSSL